MNDKIFVVKNGQGEFLIGTIFDNHQRFDWTSQPDNAWVMEEKDAVDVLKLINRETPPDFAMGCQMEVAGLTVLVLHRKTIWKIILSVHFESGGCQDTFGFVSTYEKPAIFVPKMINSLHQELQISKSLPWKSIDMIGLERIGSETQIL